MSKPTTAPRISPQRAARAQRSIASLGLLMLIGLALTILGSLALAICLGAGRATRDEIALTG